jgi:hypothetical protein
VQDNNLTLRLIAGIVLFAVTGTLSGIQLYHRDREARRLFEGNKKLWGGTKGDDAFELQKVKRRLVVGYVAFLIVSLAMLVAFLIKLLSKLGYL